MEKTLKKYFALFALPGVVCFLLAFLIPMFMGIYLSFCEFRNLADVEWVGIRNYIDAFTIDNNYSSALWFTVRFTVVTVISINILSFTLALLLTKGIKGTNIFRTILINIINIF